MAPGIGAFFPVGTFASLTGAGGGATSTTAAAGSVATEAAASGTALTSATALAFAADAFVALDGSGAAIAAFAAGALGGAAGLTGEAFAGSGVGAGLATAFAEAGAAFAGAAFTGEGFTGAAFTAVFAAVFTAVFTAAFTGATLALEALGEGLALVFVVGATALADALGLAGDFFSPVGLLGDFMLVRDADRVGEDAGFALVALAVERLTGAADFAGAALVALGTAFAVVFFVAVVLLVFTVVTAAFGFALLSAPLRDPGFPAAAFAGVLATRSVLADALVAADFPGAAGRPLAFAAGLPVGLATTFFGAGAAFFATADFADLRAGIDFDVAATMYSRYGAGGTFRSPGRRADYCLNHTNSRHCGREHRAST